MAINEFKSDTHRRVAGMLMRPRSAAEIAAEFAKHDPFVEGTRPTVDPMTGEQAPATGAYTAAGVEEYLKDLEAEGLAVNMGNFDDPKKALAAQDKHKDTVDFTGSKDAFAALSQAEAKYPYLARAEHWVRTHEAQDRLVGTAPGQGGD